MKKGAKTAIAAVAVGAAVVALGLFCIYKHFVTPQRIVLLSCMNLKDDIDSAFDYLNEDEYGIIDDYVSDGGKITTDLTVTGESALKGMDLSISSNRDEQCTVTDISLYDKLNFSVYKDSSSILINTPLFSGGFSLPVYNFISEWNDSIFGSMLPIQEGSGFETSAMNFITGGYDISEFVNFGGDDLKNILSSIEIKKNGKAAVMVDRNTKKATEYTLSVDEDKAKAILELFANYAAEKSNEEIEAFAADNGISKDDAVEEFKNGIVSMARSTELKFRIDNLTLRELSVVTDEYEYTLALSGEKNPFDSMAFYKDGDVQNAIRRSVSGNNGVFRDSISMGDTTVFTIDSKADSTDIRLNYDGITADISAYGKTLTEDTISFENIEMHLNDMVTLEGSFSISDVYDSDFSFNKSGEYIDILNIGEDEWKAVSGTVIKALELLNPLKGNM